MADDDVVERATSMITALLHFRRQAQELRACQKMRRDCPREHAAFVTCANEHTAVVIDALVKIADSKCPQQVAEYQLCKRHNIGADCEEEDLAAIRCASWHVLRSAQAAPT